MKHPLCMYLHPYFNKHSSASLRETKLHIFLSILTMQLLIVTFCDLTPGIGGSFRTHEKAIQTDGQSYVEIEIVIQMNRL